MEAPRWIVKSTRTRVQRASVEEATCGSRAFFTDNPNVHSTAFTMVWVVQRRITKDASYPSPPGFTQNAYTHDIRSRQPRIHHAADASTSTPHLRLKLKKAWDTALAPAKSIPMNGFMLWMSGSGVQIFSILITGMMLLQPIRGILGVAGVFKPYEGKDVDLRVIKMVYIAMHVASMMLGVWKLEKMGLLPTHASDWLAFMPPKQMMEISVWDG